MSDQPPKTYLDVTGQSVPCSFRAEPEEPAPPGSPFVERMLTSTNGPLPGTTPGTTEVRERRLVTPVEANDWRELDLLDNEILIGRHLVDFYGNGAGYPAELSQLVGYYGDDAGQPFILLAPYRGQPADHVVRGLMLEQEKGFQTSLVRGIRLLELAGVVHGRISPTTVRWDEVEELAQLTGFGEAVMIGAPRREGGDEPWAAAEQRSGTGPADPRDDVWSAAQVIYYVVTGRRVRASDMQPDPSARAAALQAVFGRALDPKLAARPTARELLVKLGGSDPRPPQRTARDRSFEEGMRKFEERRVDKLGQGQRTPPYGMPQSPPPGGPKQSPPQPPPSTQPPRKTQPARKKGIRGWFSFSLMTASFVALVYRRWSP